MTSPYLTNAADTITQLRELLSKATPGYWVFEAMLQTPGHGFIDAHKDRHAQSVMKNDRDVDEVAIKLEDGLLIVAAVNALPELLDRLEKLEAALPRLVEAVNALPGLLDRLAKLERRRLLGMPHPHPTGADCSRCDEADELDEELDQ